MSEKRKKDRHKLSSEGLEIPVRHLFTNRALRRLTGNSVMTRPLALHNRTASNPMVSRPPNIKFLTQPATLKAQSLVTENPSPLPVALLSAYRRTPLHPFPYPTPPPPTTPSLPTLTPFGSVTTPPAATRGASSCAQS